MDTDHPQRRGRGPDFLGIGPHRTGTSWVYAVLRECSDVWMPPIKEISYWSRIDLDQRVRSLRWRRHLNHRIRSNAAAVPLVRRMAHHPPRIEWGFDRRYFVGRASPTWYARLFDAAPPSFVTGEISPGYSAMDHQGIERLRTHLPSVRLIYFARDPYSRLWSFAAKQLARDVGRDIGEVPADEVIEFLRPRLHPISACLGRWMEHFPAEQVHLAWYDELSEDPIAYLTGVLDHIGSGDDAERLAAMFAKRVNPATRGTQPPGAAGRYLADAVLPDLHALAEMCPQVPFVRRWIADAESRLQ